MSESTALKNPPPPKKISTRPNISVMTPVSIGERTIPDTAPTTSSIKGLFPDIIPSVHPSPIRGGISPYGPFCIRSPRSFAAAMAASLSLSSSLLHSSEDKPLSASILQRSFSISAIVSGGHAVAGTSPALSAHISSTGKRRPRAENRLAIISCEENTSLMHSELLALATSAASERIDESAVPFNRAHI